MEWVGVGKEKLASISKLWLRIKSLSKGTKDSLNQTTD